MRESGVKTLRLFAAVFVLATLGAVTAAPQSTASTSQLDGLDAFVEQAMKDWKVPGVSIAVVKDGKIILSKGYGYRDVEKKLPVTSKTLFAVGSVTKSFTVTTLGTLVDEGKLDWDKPVRNYLPGFELYDPYASEHLTTRDMVTHRSGLPRHDLVWYSSDFSREEIIHRLRYLEPNKELRETFQYNNMMFMTAGAMAGNLMGMTWEEAVRQRILIPLGMTHTNLSVLDSEKDSDFAEPYRKRKEEVKLIPFYLQGAVAPAGAINSCADDMARYLLFHLSLGQLEGRRLLSAGNALQMQTPQMVIQGAPEFPELGEESYGMGFFITTYRGHKLVEHGGNIDGFSAALSFMPNDHLGVMVLANLDETGLPDVVRYYIFDLLLGLPPAPFNGRLLKEQKQGEQAEEQAKSRGFTAPKPNAHPSHALADYAGDYENPGYGRLAIEVDGDGFKMVLNRLSENLKPYHYDVFRVPENPLDPLEKLKVNFNSDLNGEVTSVSAPLEPFVKDIVFSRVAEKRMFERSFLEPFAGVYAVPGQPVTVSLRGDSTLVMASPGEPARELIPVRGTRFRLQGLNEFAIEFKTDSSGKVTEAVFYSSDSAQVFKKQ